MYRQENKPFAIREIQRFLLIIGQNDSAIPHLAVDGIYTEETRYAVSEFQRLRNLDVTGTVNKETFDLLYSESSEVQNKAQNEMKFTLGSVNEDVGKLNSILRQLSEYYRDIYPLPYGNIYSKNTALAIEYMLRHLKLPNKNYVDEKTFNRLESELKARKILEEFKNGV